MNETESEFITAADTLDKDFKTLIKDVEIVGFTVLEFSLIISGIVFLLCLVCCGVACCISIKTKSKKKKVKEQPKDIDATESVKPDGNPLSPMDNSRHVRVPTES